MYGPSFFYLEDTCFLLQDLVILSKRGDKGTADMHVERHLVENQALLKGEKNLKILLRDPLKI